jgi:hypothetical protein
MSIRSHSALVKPLEPSSCAAAALGPKTAIPASFSASASPSTSGASGPTTTRPIPLIRQKSMTPCRDRHVECDAFRHLGDARIARRAEQRFEQRAIRPASPPARVRVRPIRSAGHSSAPFPFRLVLAVEAGSGQRTPAWRTVRTGSSRTRRPLTFVPALSPCPRHHPIARKQGRVADAPSGPLGLPRPAAPPVALCPARPLGPADRLAAPAVAVLVVGRACRVGRRNGRSARIRAIPASLASGAVPDRRGRHARRRLHL